MHSAGSQRAEPGSGAMRTPSGWGRVEVSLEHAEVCCQRVCCSFGSAFSFSFLKSVFLHYFSSSLFLVVNDREKENVVVCSEIPSFLPTAAATGMEELRPFLCSMLSRAKWFSSWTRQSVSVPYSSLTFPLQLGFPLMLREWACFQFSVVKGIFSIWWI